MSGDATSPSIFSHAVIEYGGWGNTCLSSALQIYHSNTVQHLIEFVEFRYNKGALYSAGANLVHDNVFHHNTVTAISLNVSTDAQIVNNLVEAHSAGGGACSQGIFSQQGEPTITGNTFRYSSFSGSVIFASSGDAKIEHNSFVENSIYGNSSIEEAVVQIDQDINSSDGNLGPVKYNEFIGNTVAGSGSSLYVDAISTSGTHEIRFNNLLDDATYSLVVGYNRGNDISIDATNNYWGTTDATQISQLIYDFYDDFDLQKVIYEPFETQPIGNAGSP